MSLSTPHRWWGWGQPDGEASFTPPFAEWLTTTVGMDHTPVSPPSKSALEKLKIPPSRLPVDVKKALQEIVGIDGYGDDLASRITHATGRSYVDLLTIRGGTLSTAPDAVIRPTHHDAVLASLEVCNGAGIAVIPFGGGTSVVGGVNTDQHWSGATVAIDTAALNDIGPIDHVNATVTVGAGVPIPTLERSLMDAGYILGHYPQSYEFVTVGGCAATRSAGQASAGYGRFEDMIVALRCVTPVGEFRSAPHPRISTGPALSEMILGSEGILGIITECTLRILPAPKHLRYEGWMFPSFAEGEQAVRELVQHGFSATVARVSDEEETELLFRTGTHGHATERLFQSWIKVRGYEHGALAIVGWETVDGNDLTSRRFKIQDLFGQHRGMSLGSRIGASWYRGRYSAPYLRDTLMDHGILVETFETAARWDDLHSVRNAVREQAKLLLFPSGNGSIGCHISHLYTWGASLYFTVMTKQDETDPIAQWTKAKLALTDTIIAHGGAPSHHHGIGQDHQRWLVDEIGAVGMERLYGMKQSFDPNGIMNPGKVVASA